MIQVKKSRGGSVVTVNGKQIKIFEDRWPDIVAMCSFETLQGAQSDSFPAKLTIVTNSEDGFGTGRVDLAALSVCDKGLIICFRGDLHVKKDAAFFIFIAAVSEQVEKSDNFSGLKLEFADDQGSLDITSYCVPVAANKTIDKIVLDKAQKLGNLITAAENVVKSKRSQIAQLM
jgi:hypothetical protein